MQIPLPLLTVLHYISLTTATVVLVLLAWHYGAQWFGKT